MFQTSTPYIPRFFPNEEEEGEKDQICTSYTAGNGLVYRILGLGSSIPEIADDLEGPRLRYKRTVYMKHILGERIHRAEELTVASFLEARTFYLSFYHDQESLGGPWQSDDARFKGIEYRDSTLQLYDPRKIKVSDVMREQSSILLFCEIHGEPVVCVVPCIMGNNPEEFRHEIDAYVKNDCSVLSTPKFRGALGFQSNTDQYPYVVGYILQSSTLNLSKGPIQELPCDRFCAKLERSYKELRKRNLTWGGDGPQHICLDKDLEPFFDRLIFHWDNGHLQNEDDTQGFEKVMSFLKQPLRFKPRRSLRIFKREQSKQSEEVVNAEDRIPVARPGRKRRISMARSERNKRTRTASPERTKPCFPKLPSEILDMIFELAGLAPGRLTWVYNHFAIEKRGGNPRRSDDDGNTRSSDDDYALRFPPTDKGCELMRWIDGGFEDVYHAARSFFYRRNHFIVDVNRLESFFAELRRRPITNPETRTILDEKDKTYPHLRSITVRISAERMDGCGIGWCSGIEKLSRQCPQLKKVFVSIYGGNESFDAWWEDHKVLQKLRSECRDYLKEVSLAEYRYITRVSTSATEAEIFEWLRS